MVWHIVSYCFTAFSAMRIFSVLLPPRLLQLPRLLLYALRKLLFVLPQLVGNVTVAQTNDLCSQDPCIRCAGFANCDRGHWNSSGHLDYREQRVQAIE